MKQLAQYQDGRLELQEVPPPAAPPGGVLVRTACSVISPGTEKMKVEQARMSLLQKARARPDQVRKVLDTARTLGWKAALQKVRNRLESPAPLGYSAAGVVVAVDEGNARFRVGDRVACGGAECAFHAELIGVPDLLAAPVPAGVDDASAAHTTLAAIAMQAVRQADVRLGERVVVIGQGLVGLLATALIRAAGGRVLATDLSTSRLRIAGAMGAEQTLQAGEGSLADAVIAWTDGAGADAVLLCIGGEAPAIIEDAIQSLRDRGVLVVVGIFDARLPWKQAYLKDIQIRYSRSYGPGRYDPQYEWGGVDYPLGHVRWTENRQFDACLHLMKTGALDVTPLITRRAPFAGAVAVYDQLMRDGDECIGVVLDYATGIVEGAAKETVAPVAAPAGREAASPQAGALHVVGAGNFARTMLLPHLAGKIKLGVVANQTGLSARHVKEKFGFAGAETDPAKAFAHRHDAVIIATRHHLHAGQVIAALAADQHVFVEKPLCLGEEELRQIDAALGQSRGSVMVGFNRRFAPATAVLRDVLRRIPGPKALSFQVAAGPLAPDHWYANLAESGGRVLGEACHFFDFACCLLGAPVRVSAQPVGGGAVLDAVSALIEFADGSTAQILYAPEGDAGYPKETFKLFAAGLVAECENFQTLRLFQNRRRTVRKFASKGHAEEMAAWLAWLSNGGAMPLPYAQARRSTRLTFAALQSMREARMVSLEQDREGSPS